MNKLIIAFILSLFVFGAVLSAPKAYATSEDEYLEYFEYTCNHFNLNPDDCYFVGFTVWGSKFNDNGNLVEGYNPTLYVCEKSYFDSHDKFLTINCYSKQYVAIYGTGSYLYQPFHNNIGVVSYSNTFYYYADNFSNTVFPLDYYGNFPDVNMIGFSDYSYADYHYIGSATKYGSVTSISNAGLLNELYDITFTIQGVSVPEFNNLISRVYSVAPVAVRDDSGYNLISLQCPQMQINEDVVIWGYYLFKPRYPDKYYFDGLKLSFGFDTLNTDDLGSEIPLYPDKNFYELSYNNTPVKSSGILTINSISFFYGSQIRSANNRELQIYDFSSDDNDLYPVFMFHSIGSVNMFSLGSFCYNFDSSGLYKFDENNNRVKVDDDEKEELSEKGKERADDTNNKLGYIPVSLSLNKLNDGFSWDNSQTYDFSSVAELLGSIFAQPFIIALMTACAVVGLIGLVLYGKR